MAFSDILSPTPERRGAAVPGEKWRWRCRSGYSGYSSGRPGMVYTYIGQLHITAPGDDARTYWLVRHDANEYKVFPYEPSEWERVEAPKSLPTVRFTT